MPPAYEVLLLNTAIPQIQAAQSGDTYVVPRDIAFSTVASLAAGTEALPSLVATGDTNTGFWFPAADTIAASTGGTRRLTVDSSGNLGLGVTPSAWGSGYRALQLENGTALFNPLSGVGTILGANVYYGSSNFRYIGTESNATMYWQTTGQHRWYTAGSGTAGNAISFTQAMTLDASGNLGVGQPSPSYKLDVSGSARITSRLYVDTGTAALPSYSFAGWTDTGIWNPTGTSIGFSTSGSERARITSGGEWQVNGGATSVPSTSDSTLTFTGGGYATTDNIAAGVFGAIRGTVLVGGNYTGGTDIDVGNIKFLYGPRSTTSENTAAIASISALNTGTTSTSGGHLRFSTTPASGSVTERARITSGGDFVVTRGTGGDTTVGATLYANGTVTCARSSSTDGDLNLYVYSTGAAAARFYVGMGGTVYATNTTISAISDQRFKENIRDLDVGLNSIMALKPRLFDWKAGKGKNKKNDRGFIAQEIEQVFPDLVDQWADPAPEGEEPYKSVRQDLIPVLVKAIQEQQAMINELKAEVAALKGA